jgi:hypothetical protein
MLMKVTEHRKHENYKICLTYMEGSECVCEGYNLDRPMVRSKIPESSCIQPGME